jgi:hypothetical protein
MPALRLTLFRPSIEKWDAPILGTAMKHCKLRIILTELAVVVGVLLAIALLLALWPDKFLFRLF